MTAGLFVLLWLMSLPYLLEKNKYLTYNRTDQETFWHCFQKEFSVGSKLKLKEFVHSQGTFFPYHVHRHQEIIVVKSGHLRLVVEEHVIDMFSNDQIQIEPWAIHFISFLAERTNYYYIENYF